jgi:hypothetical protein
MAGVYGQLGFGVLQEGGVDRLGLRIRAGQAGRYELHGGRRTAFSSRGGMARPPATLRRGVARPI